MNFNVSPSILRSFLICHRQAWLLFHGLHGDEENIHLKQGKEVHFTSFPSKKKEITVDNFMKIDLIEGNHVAEVKKSSKYVEASKIQLAYYLFYLKVKKGLELKGILIFPLEKRRELVELTPELEHRLMCIIKDAERVLSQPLPPSPKTPEYCKKCSFFDFCHGG
ncbi:MAG: CRISPR-associated protein Cas4 [candidate division WOR-3 bacterium]